MCWYGVLYEVEIIQSKLAILLQLHNYTFSHAHMDNIIRTTDVAKNVTTTSGQYLFHGRFSNLEVLSRQKQQ